MIVVLLFVFRSSPYNEFQQRKDYDPNSIKNGFDMSLPTFGGCFDKCYGIEQTISCEEDSRQHNLCKVRCYGYHWHNCHRSKIEEFIESLF